MYSSISPPQLSPCFIPQPFSLGFNGDMNFTSSMPMFQQNYFTNPLNLIPPTTSSTTSKKLMLSPKSTPTKIRQPNHQLINEAGARRKQSSSQKKDRNCKIVTAQGVRDRRVRFSTDIARRFFDLQDSLGFDTASKTLDWLLTKSRPAIKELQTNPVVVEKNAKRCEAYVTFTGADEDSNKNKAQSEGTFGKLGVIPKKLKPSTVTSDNFEMNGFNTLFCSKNITNSSGDLQEIFGEINQ